MLGALIGRGNTADVYEIGNNRVIKLFKAGYPENSVRKEYDNSQLLNGLDILRVKSYALVSHSGRYGIVYERIAGESMLDKLLQTQDIRDLDKYANALALLHQKLLEHKLPSAVSLKSILKQNIERAAQLSISSKSKLITTLGTLPDDDYLCHGDFHFGNVMVSREQYYIIDYMNICHGHPYGDIARTVYLTEMTPVPAAFPNAEYLLQMKKRATDLYLKEMGVAREHLADWLLIHAAARLAELSIEQADEQNTVLAYLSARGL